MEKRLYIGGIPYSSTEEDLQTAFSEAGNVTFVKIIIDKMTNRSKGFGFVEMETEEGAQKAIEMFDGKEFAGRTIKVNEAKPMETRE